MKHASSLLLLVMIATVPDAAWAQIQLRGVANLASFEPGLPAGGSLAALVCLGLTGPSGTTVAPFGGPLPFQLAGVEVMVNGALAPILSVTINDPLLPYDQINFQVPLERNATVQTGTDMAGSLSVSQSGLSDTMTPTPAPSSVGFFSDANGFAVAQRAESALV